MPHTQKIIIASKNPVKMRATLHGFQMMFPQYVFEIEGISVPSGVSDQPQTDMETIKGARERVANAKTACPDADFWVGIEGGIEDTQGEMEAFAWIVVQSKEGKIGKARTGVFYLPPRVAALVREGKELGEADDIVFCRTNSKQENGAVGLLTDNIIHRADYYTHTLVLALIPFKNKELYFDA